MPLQYESSSLWLGWERWSPSGRPAHVYKNAAVLSDCPIDKTAAIMYNAGEIYSDASGDYLLSVYYPQNGISIAPIMWENDVSQP